MSLNVELVATETALGSLVPGDYFIHEGDLYRLSDFATYDRHIYHWEIPVEGGPVLVISQLFSGEGYNGDPPLLKRVKAVISL